MFNRTLTFLFAFFLTFLILPQSAEAQDQHRTEHLTPWSEIDFSDNQNIRIQQKNRHCLVAEVTNIPGRKRYLFYVNAEFETGRSVVTNRMKQAVNTCEQLIRGIVGRSHAVTFFGTNNSVPNKQSASRPVSETVSPAQEQSNDFRLAQLRADAGRNLIVSVLSGITLKDAGDYVPKKYETATVSAPDSLQQLDDLSDQASLEFRKSFFTMAEVYESGALDASAFENRIAAMRQDVSDRFDRVHARIDSLGEVHEQTQSLARNNSKRIDSLGTEVAGIDTDSGTGFGFFLGAGGQYFAEEQAAIAELGFRIENTGIGAIELSGFRGIDPNIGTVELPKLGKTQLGRSTKGGSLVWYPIHYKRLEIGPAVGYTHAEDFLRDREEFLTVYESLQTGLGLNVQIWKGFHLHWQIMYSTTQSAEASDLELQRLKSQPFGASVTLRWRF